jgi:hypothetical protein
MKITFDDSARGFVLDAFGKKESGGYIVEKADACQRVLTPRGEEIPIRDFAGVRKGSAIFLTSDIISLIEAAQVMP